MNITDKQDRRQNRTGQRSTAYRSTVQCLQSNEDPSGAQQLNGCLYDSS